MESTPSRSTSGETGSSSYTESPTPGHHNVELRSGRPMWTIVLACGTAAGLMSWLGGELAHGAFRPQLFVVQNMGITSHVPSRESQRAADLKNSTLVFAILGGLTGLATGLAGGLAVHSPTRGLKVGLLALATGAIAGALTSLGLVPLFYRELIPDTNDLLTPILIHGGIWTAIGAVGGIAFAIGTVKSKKQLADAIAGACFGAVLATIFYHVLAAAVFPEAKSTEVVANTAIVRLLAMSLVPIMIAVGAGFGAQGGFVRPTTSATADH
jgi:hypothetical protein